MKRILLAGVFAGIAMFLWEGVAHMALPLGAAGFRTVPKEAAFLAAMKEQIPQKGLYIFPAPGASGMQPAGVFSGILVAHPNGMAELSGRRSASRFLSTFW